jgi:PTH1 family peptidyl-tRNA hydrolase
LQAPIEMIVGLGNPGKEYAETRHNAGAWFVESLAQQAGVSFKFEAKFHGQSSVMQLGDSRVRLLIPTTYMNHSGQAVRAMAQFYQISPESILVAHDELDFPAGVVRLKQGGGHGGHNGLRDIIAQLGEKNFHRLRIGIGHPGHSSQVHDYVLSRPSKKDHQLIMDVINSATSVLPELASGQVQKAIRQLHTTA